MTRSVFGIWLAIGDFAVCLLRSRFTRGSEVALGIDAGKCKATVISPRMEIVLSVLVPSFIRVPPTMLVGASPPYLLHFLMSTSYVGSGLFFIMPRMLLTTSSLVSSSSVMGLPTLPLCSRRSLYLSGRFPFMSTVSRLSE